MGRGRQWSAGRAGRDDVDKVAGVAAASGEKPIGLISAESPET